MMFRYHPLKASIPMSTSTLEAFFVDDYDKDNNDNDNNHPGNVATSQRNNRIIVGRDDGDDC